MKKMKKQNEIWLVEASADKRTYQPFCLSIGCKSKSHAEELAREESIKLGLPCRVALYRRVK